MTVILMSRSEIDRMNVLLDLAEERIRVSEAVALMGLGRRQVFRLGKVFRQRGPTALVSRRRGKPSNRSYPMALRMEVIAIIRERYATGDPLVNAQRVRINPFALAARLPTIFSQREYLEAGGLMAYGPNFPDLNRRAADYVDKVLRGAKPADLPVEQPTKFDLAVNLITARALVLEIPPSLSRPRRRSDRIVQRLRIILAASAHGSFWHIPAQCRSGVMSAAGGSGRAASKEEVRF
jgi:hypothetical protein